jgi:biotin carboxyl carrier protein
VSLILLGTTQVEDTSKDSRTGPAGDGAASEIRGASFEVQVAPGSAAGELLVGFRGNVVAATVNGRRRARPGMETGGSAHGEQSIKAPMPGRVVKVLVGPGDEVVLRQPVVVVEAMKMENELRAPKAGRVRDVSVTPGMSVEAGRVLVVIE